MKKSVLVVFLLALSSVVNAQFLVESSGKAGFGVEYDSSNPLLSQLSVGDRGNSNYFMTIAGVGKNSTLKLSRSGGSAYTDHYVIDARNTEMYGLTTNYGIYTSAYNPTLITGTCQSYGLYAVAGNCQTANAGVCGLLYGSAKGAGIYGSSSTVVTMPSTNTKYAGYFYGDVYVTGSVSAASVSTPSDYRLKEDIHSLSGNHVLSNVLQMNVVGFRYRQREVERADSIGQTAPLYDNDSQILKKEHFGFIAQELKEVYPDLVTEGSDGYLSVNYMEIIPLLVSSIQELKAELDEVKESGKGVTRGTLLSDENVDPVMSAALYQNTPNPFTESTIIECEIPSKIKTALLYIYDMNGRQIDSIGITGRGHTSVTIDGGSLAAGMYLYSLIADGNVIDTRRMILTK